MNVGVDLEERISGPHASVDEMVGIALAASHLWYDSSFRGRGTTVLLALLNNAESAVRESALHVFEQREELPPGGQTVSLLDAVRNDPDLLSRIPDAFFEQIHLLLPSEAERVVALLAGFLDALDRGDRPATSLHVAGPEMVRAAVTLQRLRPFREAGMSIFERLLTRGAYGLDEVLFDLDARPRRTAPRARRARTRIRGQRTNRST